MATVFSYLFYNYGLCYHYFDGIIPLEAKNIATVFPFLSYNLGSWYHSFGISIFNYANIIAIVWPSSLHSSGLWLANYGIYPQQALSKIVILSFQWYYIGICKLYKHYLINSL